MKNLLTKVLLLLFICTTIISNIAITKANAAPYLEAQGVVLMDGKSGEILYSQNADVQYEPASITKVMTAIVVLENTNLNDNVTIGENPPMVDGSALGIREGEVYTVEELFCCGYARYFWEAIKIRYPEYCSYVDWEDMYAEN